MTLTFYICQPLSEFLLLWSVISHPQLKISPAVRKLYLPTFQHVTGIHFIIYIWKMKTHLRTINCEEKKQYRKCSSFRHPEKMCYYHIFLGCLKLLYDDHHNSSEVNTTQKPNMWWMNYPPTPLAGNKKHNIMKREDKDKMSNQKSHTSKMSISLSYPLMTSALNWRGGDLLRYCELIWFSSNSLEREHRSVSNEHGNIFAFSIFPGHWDGTDS